MLKKCNDIFAIKFHNSIVKMINNRNKLNNFDFATKRALKAQKRVFAKKLALFKLFAKTNSFDETFYFKEI